MKPKAKVTSPPTPPLTETPCPRCVDLAKRGGIRPETVQRLPEGAWAPLARPSPARNDDEPYRGKCCFDCASADTLMSRMSGLTFVMARIAVGNDRQEQYRMPGLPIGLVQQGIVRPSKDGDLASQHAWLERMKWFDVETGDEG